MAWRAPGEIASPARLLGPEDVPFPSLALRSKHLPQHIRDAFSLSERQLDCLLLARAGLTNKGVGRELGVSPRTVEIYKRQARECFGCVQLVLVILMLDRLLVKEGL